MIIKRHESMLITVDTLILDLQEYRIEQNGRSRFLDRYQFVIEEPWRG